MNRIIIIIIITVQLINRLKIYTSPVTEKLNNDTVIKLTRVYSILSDIHCTGKTCTIARKKWKNDQFNSIYYFGNACLNKYVLSSRLNTSIFEQFRNAYGREFHTPGALCLKAASDCL